MARYAEALPQPDQIERRVQAYLTDSPVVVFAEGQQHTVSHPANFPDLLDGYLLNRDSKTSDSLIHTAYQDYLMTDPNGIATTQALDKIIDGAAEFIKQAKEQSEEEQRIFYYARLVEVVATHLPPNVDASILRDPRLAEDVA